MLKEIVIPTINMNEYNGNTIETGLVIMSNDSHVNAIIIPFYPSESVKSIQVCYTFKNNSSTIIQDVSYQNGTIVISLIEEVRKHQGVFYMEVNVYFNYSQATIVKMSAVVKRSLLDTQGEFLFNHYYKLFEEYEKELEEFKNGLLVGYSDEFTERLKKMLADYENNRIGLTSIKIGVVEE